jgi:conjugative relaxase-like TrwC/TraI family protein
MKSAGTAVAYYLDERKEEYYLNGIDKQGRWFGGAAEEFGLAGRTVTQQEFRNLLDGFSPDGREALVQNAGQSNRDACWDMTFSAPKEVAVFWAMSPPATRRLIEQELLESAQAALTKAQEVAGITRSGPGGKIKERAELMWATFLEGSSRAQDPQPHIHAVLVNLGRRQDGRFGSLYTPNLFRWKMPLGAMFQAELASRLTRRFGLQIEAREAAFGIRGVPQDLCRYFSRRRQIIERTMAERGVAGAIEAKTAAKDTRPQKEEVPPKRLFSHWQQTGKAFGWHPEQVMNLRQSRREKPITVEQFGQRVRQIVQETPPKQQTRSHLVRASARAAFEQGVDGETLFQSFNQLRLPDGHKVLWQPRWQDQRAARQAETKELGARHGLQQPPQRTEKPQARSKVPARPIERQVAPELSAAPRAAARQPETPGRKPQPSHAPDGVPPTQECAEPASPHSERPLSHESSIPPPSQSEQVADSQSRKQTRHERRGKAKRKRRAGRQKHQEQERARADERKATAHEQAQAKDTRSSERRRFVHLRWKALYEKRPWVAERGRFLHVHWKQPFRRALWGRLRNVQVPTIGIELPRLGLGAPKSYVPRWWSIRWKKDLLIGELRIQDRVLFRNAPKWNPLHGLTLPALRFTLEKSKWKPMKAPQKSRRPSKHEGKSKDHGHAH